MKKKKGKPCQNKTSTMNHELNVVHAASGSMSRVSVSAQETVQDLKLRLATTLHIPANKQILLFDYVNLPASQTLDLVFQSRGDVGALVRSLSVSVVATNSGGAASTSPPSNASIIAHSYSNASTSSTSNSNSVFSGGALPRRADSGAPSVGDSAASLCVYVYDANWVNLDQCPALPLPATDADVAVSPVPPPPANIAPSAAAMANFEKLSSRERTLAGVVARVSTQRRRLELHIERCGAMLHEHAAQRAAIEATVKNLVDFHIDRVVQGYDKTAALIQHHSKEQARVLATFDADAHKLELIALHSTVATPRYRTLADLVDIAGYRLRADSCRQLADQLERKLVGAEQLVSQSRSDAELATRVISTSLPELAPFFSQLARLRDAASSAVALEARVHAQHKSVRTVLETGKQAAAGEVDTTAGDALEIEALNATLDEARALYSRCINTRQATSNALFNAMRREKPIAEVVDRAKLELGGIRPALRKWRQDIARLTDVHRYPIVYVNALAEVARRRAYALDAQQRFGAFAASFGATHDAELARRRAWNRANLRFVAPLFPAVSAVPGASPVPGATSLDTLPRLAIELHEFDTALPRVEHQDAVRTANAYGVALDEIETDDDDNSNEAATPAVTAAPAVSSSTSAVTGATTTTNADDNDGELSVYRQRIKELEERLEEQFARMQYESMDKSMSDATSTQLRKSRRAQRDAEKQLTEVSERLAAALSRAGEAERALTQANEDHERAVRELTESAMAQVEEAKQEVAVATAAALSSEAAAAAKNDVAKVASERDALQNELDAARRQIADVQKEHEHFVQVVAAANAARTKAQQAATESRAKVETLQNELKAAQDRIHQLEAARAESVVEADEVRASRDRVANSINLLQNDIAAADQRMMQQQQELTQERTRRTRGDDALTSVVTILRAADASIGESSTPQPPKRSTSSSSMSASTSLIDDNSSALQAVECAKRAAAVIADLRQSSVTSSGNKSVGGAHVADQTLRIGVGALAAGDVAMFIPRLTREMTNSSSPAQYVYEAVTMQSGSLSSMDGVTDGSVPRYFLDISAAEAFSQEMEKKLPIVGEIVEFMDQNIAANAPPFLSFLKAHESYAIVIVSRGIHQD
jgi:hypothetical protein